LKKNKLFGPSTLVTAAFIGPGTVTTCTLAGVETGYTLIWAMVFSIVATIVLQEMAARLGFITRSGLGEALRAQFTTPGVRLAVFALVIGAILIGNAAYESGNLSGGVLGLDLLIGKYTFSPLILGAICFLLLYFGSFKSLEKILIGLVILMSLFYLMTVIIVKPDVSAIVKGLIPTRASFSNLNLILGIIGTTVVPYNLFLHASTISKKWDSKSSLADIRSENRSSIILGGLISIMIMITAAASSDVIQNVTNASDLAIQLEPLFGNSAKILMGVGLFAAGLSSTLTAPIAAAYAAKGLFNLEEGSMLFRLVWMSVLGIGIIVAMSGIKPIMVIQFAQIANAILLPLIAAFLIYISNSRQLLGQYTNRPVTNIIAIIIIGITILLSLRSLNSIFGLI
jgi:NRAMP (natural resistance-associated macrophage protein)-like metal ion transporter